MTAAATLTDGGFAKSQASLEAMETAMQGFQRTTLADLLGQQEQLVTQQKEAGQIEDTAVRAARLEIINADMSKLEAKIADYREDTAELIAGLEAQFEKLGLDLTALQKPTPEDLRIQESAEAHLKKLIEVDGPAARALLVQKITDAKGGMNPFGRAARIQEAENALEAFDVQQQEDVAAAKLAVEEAKAEVERLRRKRIREAEFDSQFERFIALAQQIMVKLLENVKNSEVQMTKTQKELSASLDAKEGLAKEIAGLEAKIQAAENTVLGLEQEKSGALDQESRSAVETRLGAANQALADLTGTRQEKQVAFNSFEAAAVKHEQMLASLQVQRDNQRSHARKLQIDSRARFTQAQNLVRIIQNTAQEDAASRLHSAGSSLDRMSVQIAAQSLIASERERLKLYTGHEADMKALDETGSALAEGRAQIAVQDAEIAERMKNNYGIDPLGASWLHLAQGMGNADASAPAP